MKKGSTEVSATPSARFERDGIVIAAQSLSSVTVAKILAKMEAFLAARPELSSDYVPDLVAYDRSWVDIAREPALLDAVASVIGEDIILWGSALFCKTSHGGRATPWHQDAQYWPIRPLQTVTTWVALDAASVENGCLRVLPGSHRSREIYAHHRDDSEAIVLNQAMASSDIAESDVLDVELSPGQFSVHDAFLVHGANANRSPHRRAGLTFRYMPASSVYDRDLARRQVEELGVVDVSQRELHLVRGRDVSGRNDVYQTDNTRT
ncbi:MAG: phytanoyl-CoA dioxygenase family protein [Gammaproteobacteria bacterium]|nr:phytanoyl-CoA dioxygenase family protein [Gammaproteobacteria bacterium]